MIPMPPRPIAPALAAAALCLPACTFVVLDRFPPYEPREASPLLVASQGRSSGEPRAFIPPRARPAPPPAASATGPICPSETPVRLHREVKRKKLPTPTPPDLPARWKNEPARWKDLEIGADLRLRYPPDIFAADKVSDGVRLVSALSVDAPHGADDPGADGRHWFRVSARVRPLPLLGAFCEVLPYMASVVFPGGQFEESVSAKKFALAKREAYRVWAGIHGYDEQHIFVLLNEGSTLVLSFDSIGESLEHIVPKKVRGVAQKQEEIIQGLLESLR